MAKYIYIYTVLTGEPWNKPRIVNELTISAQPTLIVFVVVVHALVLILLLCLAKSYHWFVTLMCSAVFLPF